MTMATRLRDLPSARTMKPILNNESKIAANPSLSPPHTLPRLSFARFPHTLTHVPQSIYCHALFCSQKKPNNNKQQFIQFQRDFETQSGLKKSWNVYYQSSFFFFLDLKRIKDFVPRFLTAGTFKNLTSCVSWPTITRRRARRCSLLNICIGIRCVCLIKTVCVYVFIFFTVTGRAKSSLGELINRSVVRCNPSHGCCVLFLLYLFRFFYPFIVAF